MASFWENFAEAMGWGKANHTGHLSNLRQQTTSNPGVYSERREKYMDYDDIRDETVKSLRSGEDYAIPMDNLPKKNSDSKYIGNKIFSGGIGEGRYLGHGVGDVTSSAYFSNEKATDKFKPLKITMKRTHQDGDPYVGDFTVKYDDDGAISEIDIDSDMNMDYMDDEDRRLKRYAKGDKITGAGSISDFFKKLGVASDESDFLIWKRSDATKRGVANNDLYDWYTGPKDQYLNRSGLSERSGISSKDVWAPTAIFGSKGVLNEPRSDVYGKWKNAPLYQNNNHYVQSWNEVGYGNSSGSGKDAWSKHWSEVRKQMQGGK